MGLDLRPLGKPKVGKEQRFEYIFDLLRHDDLPEDEEQCEELRQEWFDIQIDPEITLGAPQVGKDAAADAWFETWYRELDDPDKPAFEDLYREYQGYYVVSLAREQDGVPVYVPWAGDETAFRGQMLTFCQDVLTAELINEAWESHSAAEALDYAQRLEAAADAVAEPQGLGYLKTQRDVPDADKDPADSLESQLHIVYSLVRWLQFYASRGHGFEADY